MQKLVRLKKKSQLWTSGQLFYFIKVKMTTYSLKNKIIFSGLAALQSRNSSSQLVLSKKDSISSTESLSPSPSESRGTPDGCGLDLVNSSPELLTKKGWLMKQGLTKEWHKYW